MRFAATATGRPAWSKFHQKRDEARRLYLREDEATEDEQLKYAIDEDDPVYPLGGIPGEMYEEGYKVEDAMTGERHDYRDTNPTV